MLFQDTYRTIEKNVLGEFKDKGSKFLAYAFPFSLESDLKPLLETLRKEHFKAVHFCYAYRLGLDRSVFRINDDGEPSGTAGRPILNVLLSKDITNILVVVVRYFGGTLLGVPGLINAYKSATEEALKVANILELTVNETYNIKFTYVQMNEVMKVVKEFDLNIINQKMDNDCEYDLQFRKSIGNQVIGKLEKIAGIEITFLN